MAEAKARAAKAKDRETEDKQHQQHEETKCNDPRGYWGKDKENNGR